MLRQIYIDKYNKIVSSFKPEIFGSLTLLESRPYSQTVERYVVVDDNNQPYQLYYTQKPLEMVLNEIPFIEHAPKVLVFPNEKENIIIEENIDDNLYQTLIANEQNSQYVQLNEDREVSARQILRGLRVSLQNYIEHNIDYNAINPKNIVRKNKIDYQLSLVGLLLKTEKQSEDYYKTGVTNKLQPTYALGTLLFKLLFGFVPFQKKKELIKFNFKDYPKYLDKEQNKKYLKVYSYAQGLLLTSPLAKQLIQEALSGTMSLESFYNHRYFQEGALIHAKKDVNPITKEIKMLTIFDQSHQSLIMAAIEHRKKYPHERLNTKLIYAHEFTKQEIVEHIKKHPILGQMQFDANFKEEKIKTNPKQLQNTLHFPDIPYFYREEEFDSELDLPCYDLIKLIDSEKKAGHIGDDNSEQLEEKIKLYAFPYAVVFQLLRVSKLQPLQIQNKILNLSDQLLQVSQLYYYKQIQPLHSTHLLIKSFDQIKIRFREHINQLYKYFLSEAIKKYNVKKDLVSYTERANSKKMGLQYYKLCLKLMECSVLNRKKGRELDLQRIETSTRKQVQTDLSQLLKQYFPNKIEHF